MFFSEDGDLHPIVREESFKKVHSEPIQSVTAGDEDSVDHTFLRHIEQPPETSSSHIQARADVGEDQRTCSEVQSAMSGEGSELAVEVTIGLLTVTNNSCIDSTAFLGGMSESLQVESP